jgi:hypothetical protein
MNIESFLLCDAATDQRGKLNVLGAFDNIFAKARIRFSKIEAGDHGVRIFIIDADGNSIGPKLEGNISVRIGDNAPAVAVNLILNIQNLEFKEYGQYQIDLAVDGNVQASLPLTIRQLPQQH